MGMTSQELTEKIADLIDGKLGEDIVALDMRELVTYTDFLVIATARNERMADGIAEEIHVRLKKEDSLLPVNPDRSGDVGWTVMDYLDTRGPHLHGGSPRPLRSRRALARSTPARAQARPRTVAVDDRRLPQYRKAPRSNRCKMRGRCTSGAVAQLEERRHGMAEVRGSIPLSST